MPTVHRCLSFVVADRCHLSSALLSDSIDSGKGLSRVSGRARAASSSSSSATEGRAVFPIGVLRVSSNMVAGARMQVGVWEWVSGSEAAYYRLLFFGVYDVSWVLCVVTVVCSLNS